MAIHRRRDFEGLSVKESISAVCAKSNICVDQKAGENCVCVDSDYCESFQGDCYFRLRPRVIIQKVRKWYLLWMNVNIIRKKHWGLLGVMVNFWELFQPWINRSWNFVFVLLLHKVPQTKYSATYANPEISLMNSCTRKKKTCPCSLLSFFSLFFSFSVVFPRYFEIFMRPSKQKLTAASLSGV